MDSSNFLQKLVENEVRRHVLGAAHEGGMLQARTIVDAVLRTYPRIDVTDHEIENMVIAAASRAQLPVEMGRGSQKD